MERRGSARGGVWMPVRVHFPGESRMALAQDLTDRGIRIEFEGRPDAAQQVDLEWPSRRRTRAFIRWIRDDGRRRTMGCEFSRT